MNAYTVSHLAHDAGVSVHVVRDYMLRGLLRPVERTAAFTPEGAEYVEHFCGLECYQRFQARAKTGSETAADPNACGSPPSD